MRPVRRFELFACVTIVDQDTGNVLEFSHGCVAKEDGPVSAGPREAQLSFDDFMEREALWAMRMDEAEGFEEEFDATQE